MLALPVFITEVNDMGYCYFFFLYNMLFSSDVTEYAAEKLYFMLVTIKRDWLKC